MIFTAGFAYSILLILTINTMHSSQIKLKMDGGFYLLVVIGLVSLGVVNSVHGQGTRVGFYSSTCPRAESIVRSTVQSHLNSDLTLAAGLLRMHFHDCFVQGCDGSVLIAGNNTERSAVPNLALRGFEVIDDAKTQLEAACPNVVSCADILSLAARDSVVLSGGVSWQVPTGRRDGVVSRESDVDKLPGPDDSVDLQKQKFAALGLDTKDLVTLVGGHTIGTTSCGLLSSRLYNFNGRNGPDPTIDPSFLPQLQALCPQNGGAPSKRVPLDNGSQTKFDTSYFNNVKKGRGILQSDQALWTDPSTKALVQRYSLGLTFNVDFGNSMVKMSNIGVKTGSEGEIRKKCSAFN